MQGPRVGQGWGSMYEFRSAIFSQIFGHPQMLQIPQGSPSNVVNTCDTCVNLVVLISNSRYQYLSATN